MNTLSSLNSKDSNFIRMDMIGVKFVGNMRGFGYFAKKNRDEEIYIVAHSMGGLLIHTYCQWVKMQKNYAKYKKVITLGTPWQGSPDSFKALKYGVKDKGYFSRILM